MALFEAPKAVCSMAFEPTEAVAEEGVEGVEGVEADGLEAAAAPTTTLDPATETVNDWPDELEVGLVGLTVAEAGEVEAALDPPDDAAGATAVPMGASAAAPNMIIDTTTASHTARVRGVMGWPFTPLGHLNLWRSGGAVETPFFLPKRWA